MSLNAEGGWRASFWGFRTSALRPSYESDELFFSHNEAGQWVPRSRISAQEGAPIRQGIFIFRKFGSRAGETSVLRDQALAF